MEENQDITELDVLNEFMQNNSSFSFLEDQSKEDDKCMEGEQKMKLAAKKKQSLYYLKNNEGEQFMLRIANLVKDNFLSMMKLKQIEDLSQCEYPNLIEQKIYRIHGYQCSVIKKENTLFEEIVQKKHLTFTEEQILSIGLQLLCSLKFIEDRCQICTVSLDTILIDQQRKHIFIFDYFNRNLLLQMESVSLDINSVVDNLNHQLFYLPPEVRNKITVQSDQENEEPFSVILNELRVWQFGVCMSLIAGASFEEVEDLSKGVNNYKNLHLLSDEFNNILSSILESDPLQRPSIEQIIQKLYLQYRKIRQPRQIPQSEEEELLLKQTQTEIDSFMYSEAVISGEKLIELNQFNDHYYALLGFAQLELRDFINAQQSCLKSLEINPLNDLALSNMAYLQMQERRYTLQVGYASFAMHLNPQNPWAYLIQAFEFNRNGQYSKSLSILSKAVEIAQNCPYIQLELGNTYRNLSREKEAINCYKQCQQIHQNYINIYWKLGNIFWPKQKSNALKCYKSITKISKSNEDKEDAFGMMVRLHSLQQNYEKGIKHGRKGNEFEYLTQCKAKV